MPLRLWLPDLASLDPRAAGLAVLSAILLLRLHWGVPQVLTVSGGLGFLIWAASRS